MGNIALSVEGLGKRYRIGQRKAAYSTLREKLSGAAAGLFRGNGAEAERGPKDFWALKDVSFEIKHGEVVGVIGRNGAGKSTLLKVLSRITEPTEGRARVYGRVGSLLEVGTGFHPELTGRENIYLNGAILGMSKADINRKFDEIVAFAEVEQFLDTPVKRYSSGMQLRLGFAVAAHLDPDILIVDEVLAVGDVAFQTKCMGKMKAAAGSGRTVLLVSHNMASIQRLCKLGLLLDNGKIKYTGDITSTIQKYLDVGKSSAPLTVASSDQLACAGKSGLISFSKFSIRQGQADPQQFVTHHPTKIEISYELLKEQQYLRVGFDIYDDSGKFIFRSFSDDDPSVPLIRQQPGLYTIIAELPANLLREGTYTIFLTATIHMTEWITINSVSLNLKLTHRDGTNAHYFDARPGLILPLLPWICRSS